MILPNLILPGQVNCLHAESGLDSLLSCRDKKHFLSYADKVEYRYNSRGFRDREWPEALQSAIWCIGDSFTTGIGSAYENTWPQILSSMSGFRIVNISMNGASNNWISRCAREISDYINPNNIVIMWSYVERREKSVNLILNNMFREFYNIVKGRNWPQCPTVDTFSTLPMAIRQELANNHVTGPYFYISADFESVEIVNIDELRIDQVIADQSDHVSNFNSCIESLKDVNSNLIYSFIPDFAEDKYQNDYVNKCRYGKIIPLFKKLDLARDGYHFDKITSQHVAAKIISLLK